MIRPWTAAEITKLRRMITARMPVQDIAKVLDRTPNSITQAQHRLGLHRPKRVTPEIVDEIIWRHQAGQGPCQIGRRLGLSYGNVAYHLRKHGVISPERFASSFVSKPYDADVVRLSIDGLSDAHIAMRLGLKTSQVRCRLIALAHLDEAREALDAGRAERRAA